MRARSYTPSPPRGYSRRGRSRELREPRGRYGRGDASTSLLVRNLRRDIRPEDLRRPFGQFGPLKDIYLPRDYYTGEPRGFGFVQYVDPADAAEAKYQMDGQVLQGREVTVVFAEENRKKPTEMRTRERGGGRGRVYDQRRQHSRSPSYSRSPPRHERSHSRDYYSRKRRSSRSASPHEKRYSRERSFTPREKGLSPPPQNSAGPGLVRERSPYGSRSRSQSPGPVKSPPARARPARSPSRSQSPCPAKSPPARARPAHSPSRSRSRNPYPS